MVKHDIIIIGAGASGLMAAGRYKERDIAIIEGNAQIAQKIKISGGGKCNITNKNVSVENYAGDHDFVAQILHHYTQHDLLSFLNSQGLRPTLRKESQYFCPNRSDELITVLARGCRSVPIYTNQKVMDVSKKEDFIITTNKGVYQAKKLVVASGGMSYPKIGATDIGYRIAETFGHKIKIPKPALVGLSLQKEQFWMKALSGISLPVCIGVDDKNLQAEMLLTHRGISGPAVLNASLYWQKGQISIDFLPGRSLESLFGSKKQISTQLGLPKRFAKAFLEVIGVADKSMLLLGKLERERLQTLKAYTFAPAGNFGFSKAEVTLGGVCTDEIDVHSMMSQKCDGLYFLGECLDVTGELGGYNFQWAFSSAQKLLL